MTNNTIYGIHPVTSMLTHKPDEVLSIYVNYHRRDKRLEEVIRLAKKHNIELHTLSPEQLKKNFKDIPHQGVVAVISEPKQIREADLEALLQSLSTPPFVLILDGITDPHNLGACLRSADAAGVDMVITPKDNSADITAAVRKVASGATETIPFVRVTNLVRTIKLLKEHNIWVYGADGAVKETIYHLDFKGGCAMVLGAEGKGLRRLTKEHCDGLFSLPMLGQVESLNVSVATGICLYEVRRQRLSL